LITYLWVTLGSALGGLLRFAIGRAVLASDLAFPFSTLLINIVGCFVIGFYGTATLSGSRYETSENMRLFVMVGLCGGFTTFSAFSLQTFDLMRSGAWGRAAANVVLSVTLGILAVTAGHYLAQRNVANQNAQAVAQTREEEFTG
jgi:CrcB protein